MCYLVTSFFFQAEDGIRDYKVTGVQTCALPISTRVRLVVPTSRSVAPDFDITSGMRKEPPISTNSPRETRTSPPSASEFNASRTAAALLLTTMVEMAVEIARELRSAEG